MRFALCLILTLQAAPLARSASGDDLLRHVPMDVDTVVEADHGRLSAHPSYADMLRFLWDQGWGAGLYVLTDAGLVPGRDVKRAVSFQQDGRTEGQLFSDVDPARLRDYGKANLGAAFATGEVEGIAWFTIHQGLHAAALGDGVVAVAPPRLMKPILRLAAGKGRSVLRKKGFARKHRFVTSTKPPVWSLSWVPETARSRLARRGSADVAQVHHVAFWAHGDADLEIQVVAFAADDKAAAAVAQAMKGKIERKILGSTLLRALGVAALVSQVQIEAKGSRVEATVPLAATQVGLLSKLGSRIISVLRQ